LVGLFRNSDSKTKNLSSKKKELRKLVKQKKYDAALEIGLEILKKIPHENDVLFIIGGIYYLEKQYQTAISFFEKSLKIATYDTEVLILKANSHFNLGKKNMALQCCQKIKEIDPKNKSVSELLAKINSTS
jgi:tetratricopeptide (TPR) repeat protein